MTTSAEQIRAYAGPALFSYGFRPFFLFGSAWAAGAVAIWLPMLTGELQLATQFTPIEWHVHELLFGYVPAVVAGFLLTAVPNWTGRLPVVGRPLIALFGLWLCGRAAIATSSWIGPAPAAAIDLSFLLLLAVVVAREIVAGRNQRNLRVLAGVALLLIGNALFHVGVQTRFGPGPGERLGVAATVLLIMLIGGRIIPSFTHNWLAQRKSPRMPAPFGKFDVVVMALSGIALASWVVLIDAPLTATLSTLAFLLNVVRLIRWEGHRTAAEPLVLILHVAYAFVPIGFGLLALGIVAPNLVTPTGALHGWTVGAIALMTLAVMTRASLGHTGQPLKATRPITAIYIAGIIAAIARILAAFGVARDPMLHLSAVAWVAAFAGFVIVYAPLLVRPRA
jgi:uncharacterized protein involved in response to NO